MFKSIVGAFQTVSLKTLAAAGLAACLSMIGSAQAAAIDISTGIQLTGNVDNIWKVASSDVVLGSSDLQILDPGYPVPPWMADSAASKWLVPVSTGQTNAPTGNYEYSTKFSITAADIAAGATLSGQYLSDNEATRITLSDGVTTVNLTPLNTPPTSFRNWTVLNAYNFTTAGTYTLTFHVFNDTNTVLNPTGFRFEGNYTGAVPEPGSLVMGALSTLALGGLSWKRRAARKS